MIQSAHANVILSPHARRRCGGRHLIGDMILHDVRAILEGGTKRMLKPADLDLCRACFRAKSVEFYAEHIAMLNWGIIGTGNIARSMADALNMFRRHRNTP